MKAAARLLCAALPLSLCAVLPVLACPLAVSTVPAAPSLQQAGVQAAWQAEGAPITVGRLFAISVQLCPETAVLARVDAWMPEHRHGMNYRPSVTRLGPGRWRAEGLMFHMPGRWQLKLDVRLDPQPDAGRDQQPAAPPGGPLAASHPAAAARLQLTDTIVLP